MHLWVSISIESNLSINIVTKVHKMWIGVVFLCLSFNILPRSFYLSVEALSINSNSDDSSRRFFFTSVVAATTSTFAVSSSSPAFAKSSVNSSLEKDKTKIVAGYKRLNYLLDNWEKMTTVCGNNDNVSDILFYFSLVNVIRTFLICNAYFFIKHRLMITIIFSYN